jgi:hypothetical protein
LSALLQDDPVAALRLGMAATGGGKRVASRGPNVRALESQAAPHPQYDPCGHITTRRVLARMTRSPIIDQLST